MREQIDYIQNKVDKIEERMDSIDKTLTINTTLLAEHIKRTNILEEQIIPINDHVRFVNKLTKLMAWIIGAASTLLAALFSSKR